jgi:flagellar basal-body rod protein FlgB
MSRFDQVFGISQQVLVLRSQRSAVLAANIANADTPRYLAQDYDFKAMLDAAQDSLRVDMTTSDNQHIRIRTNSSIGGLLYRVPSKEVSNGNTVEGEIEQAAFSDNALRYQASLQFLNGTISTLRKAIKGD